MRKTAIVLIATTVFCLSAFAAKNVNSDAVAKARTAARSWLALMDGGQYAKAWEEAAPVVQQNVTKAQWTDMMTKSWSALGHVLSRKLEGAEFKTGLPGAPAGEYVAVTYDTHVSIQGDVREQVVLIRGKDGVWRVAGYHFLPPRA